MIEKNNEYERKNSIYRVSDIRLILDHDERAIITKLLSITKLKIDDICDVTVVSKSVDARKKPDIYFAYTVNFSLTSKGEVKKAALEKNIKVRKLENKSKELLIQGTTSLKQRPIVIGFGPAGMFAALTLAQKGYAPIVIERGKSALDRANDVQNFWDKGILNEDSNVQFGEGGAGTFSDGKLTTNIKDPRIVHVLTTLNQAGASDDILIMKKPHIGTDVLIDVVANIRKEIIRLGGRILFSHRALNFHVKNDTLESLDVLDIQNDKIINIKAEQAILSIGHSARDTFEVLYDCGIAMKQKPFSIGVRIEHPQKLIDEAQYGKEAIERFGNLLKPAEYKLSHRCTSSRGVYTFCMCPGGVVISAASEKGLSVTNGMSYKDRSLEYANSGLLVDVRTSDFGSDHPLAGMYFQRKYEKLAYENARGYSNCRCSLDDFMHENAVAQKVINSLPRFAVDSIKEAMPHLGRKLKGFDSPTARLTAVETRSSSPITLLRDENLQSNIKGLYPCGEGAGYAGGIVSASCDGIKVAEQIIKNYAPYEEM